MYHIKEKNIFFIILLLSLILLINVSSYWVYTNDDAYITFRYSRNLSSGIGPVYNEGECVEGYTNFLWMIIFSGLLYIVPSLDISFAGKFLGTFCSLITLLLTVCLSIEIRSSIDYKKGNGEEDEGFREFLPFLSLLLLAANPCFAINAVSGLETTFFTMLVTAGIYLDVKQIKYATTTSPSSIFFALSALTRPEGFLIAFSSYLFKNINLFRAGKKQFAKSLLNESIIYSLAFIPFFLFRVYFYGEIFPNTFYAKIGGFGSGFFYILRFFYEYGFFVSLALLLISFLFIRKCSSAYYPAIVMLLYFSGIVIWGSDWMEGYRMITPLLPVVFILVQEGIIGISDYFMNAKKEEAKSGIIRQEWIVISLVFFISLFSIAQSVESRARIFTRAYGYEKGHIKLARWLESKAREGDTIALMDIGIIGYFNPDKKILDITGLTDKHIAKSKGRFLHKDYDLKYIFDKNPEYIVLVSKKRLEVSNSGVTLMPRDFWSSIEQKISADEYFRKNYILTGIFEHNYPDKAVEYYLNLFARKDLL